MTQDTKSTLRHWLMSLLAFKSWRFFLVPPPKLWELNYTIKPPFNTGDIIGPRQHCLLLRNAVKCLSLTLRPAGSLFAPHVTCGKGQINWWNQADSGGEEASSVLVLRMDRSCPPVFTPRGSGSRLRWLCSVMLIWGGGRSFDCCGACLALLFSQTQVTTVGWGQ